MTVAIPTHKTCSLCGIEKPLTSFAKHPTCKYGRNSRCRTCRSALLKEYYSKHPDKRHREPWEYKRERRYGISPDRYATILMEQGNRCAICDASKPGGHWKTWNIDHDHTCCPGRTSCGDCVRGLLCAACNLGLGFFKDNPERLAKAIRYLGA